LNKTTKFSISLLLFVLLTGCQPDWSLSITSGIGKWEFTKTEYKNLIDRFPANEYCDGLLLEQVLYENEIEVVDSIEIDTSDGEKLIYAWEDAAEALCINENGELTTFDGNFKSALISIDEAIIDEDRVHITNIPPTVLSALDLPHESMPEEVLITDTYDHVVMIFLDGFGFRKFQYAVEKGLINFQENAELIKQAITVYPPRTITGSAAVVTGLLPKENGVDRSGIRKTEATTIFDVAAENGISSIAIEGESLAFNLRNTELKLSGDRDLNGGTDDNVLANALEVINNSMPRLLWIHFHGIDDYGHTYGPADLKVDEKIVEVNGYLEQIYSALPENTLIIFFADHGMHAVHEEGRSGNHGHLIPEDMLVPVIIKTK